MSRAPARLERTVLLLRRTAPGLSVPWVISVPGETKMLCCALLNQEASALRVHQVVLVCFARLVGSAVVVLRIAQPALLVLGCTARRGPQLELERRVLLEPFALEGRLSRKRAKPTQEATVLREGRQQQAFFARSATTASEEHKIRCHARVHQGSTAPLDQRRLPGLLAPLETFVPAVPLGCPTALHLPEAIVRKGRWSTRLARRAATAMEGVRHQSLARQALAATVQKVQPRRLGRHALRVSGVREAKAITCHAVRHRGHIAEKGLQFRRGIFARLENFASAGKRYPKTAGLNRVTIARLELLTEAASRASRDTFAREAQLQHHRARQHQATTALKAARQQLASCART
mmetsp:Transcript_73050/g.152554  ORF Transcript_73050/g.152554 Transcript_73050/m.152554 type:complete len:349 (-) Transcript_73050:1916-2962(-)